MRNQVQFAFSALQGGNEKVAAIEKGRVIIANNTKPVKY